LSSPYELKWPTRWASPPKRFSFTSLQAIASCPRRWQLLESEWGTCARFPERTHPAALEGQIVHAALDRLSRALGSCGRPPLGSPVFQAAALACGFWNFFSEQVVACNARLAQHPRAGPNYIIRTAPRELANRAIQLFREAYRPGSVAELPRTVKRNGGASPSSVLSLLRHEGVLSEVRLEHPTLPLMGILDLVTMDDAGHVTVADFKTGEAKDSHKLQLLLYGLLWWRACGTPPTRIKIQYLDHGWDVPVTASELTGAEEAASRDIAAAKEALTLHPAPARTSPECFLCAVRARCDEGWRLSERSNRPGASANVELVVMAGPSPSGFIGQKLGGAEVPIVYDYAVGRALPAFAEGTRLRLVDVQSDDASKRISIRPWSEVYVLS
jgi:hypothetical protein